jgi:microcystin-dependent protein
LTNSGATFPFGANTNGSGGAGSTHFRIPNMVDKFVTGAGNAYSVGATGGKNSVTLDTTQIPSHTHTLTDPGHSHTFVAMQWPGGQVEQNQSGGPEDRSNVNAGRTTSSAVTGITIDAFGGGQSHENRPPYFALIYLMRIR